jgi:hypothetical protein
MISFLKSELFGKFLGGFVLGAVLVFTLGGGEESVALEGNPAAVAALGS